MSPTPTKARRWAKAGGPVPCEDRGRARESCLGAGRLSASTCSRAVLHSKHRVVTGRAIRRLNPIGSEHSSHSSISPAVEPAHGLADLLQEERLAVVQAELGRVDLLLGGLVHRVAADPVAVPVHRELEPEVCVVCQAVEVCLQPGAQLVGLVRGQHGFSLRTGHGPSIVERPPNQDLLSRAGARAGRLRPPRSSAIIPGVSSPAPGVVRRTGSSTWLRRRASGNGPAKRGDTLEASARGGAVRSRTGQKPRDRWPSPGSSLRPTYARPTPDLRPTYARPSATHASRHLESPCGCSEPHSSECGNATSHLVSHPKARSAVVSRPSRDAAAWELGMDRYLSAFVGHIATEARPRSPHPCRP